MGFLILAPVHTTFAYLGGQTPDQEMIINEVKALPRDQGRPESPVNQAKDKDENVNLTDNSLSVTNGPVTTVAADNGGDNSMVRPVGTSTAPARSFTPSRGNTGSRYSQQDIHDLARLVFGEARGEPFTGQVAVAAVVINRLESGKFGNSIQQIIYEPGAFTAISDGQFYLTPDDGAYRAVDAALGGWDPSGGAVFYWNPVTATNKWVWSRTIINSIGKHVFAI